MISPVGPTQPATITLRPEVSATSRPISAEMRDSSAARFSAACNLRRDRLPPNELVRKRSDPASTLPLYKALIFSGAVLFHSSGASPEDSPMLNKLVPVAPSAKTQSRFESII